MPDELKFLYPEEKELPPIGEPVKAKNGTKKGFIIRMDSMQSGVEANYYWILRFMKAEGPHFGMEMSGEEGNIMKLKDLSTAGEASAFWGSLETRRTVQQEKAQQMMMNIGNLVKVTFGMVRELRIIDERLKFYEESYKGDHSAEVVLKGVWSDQVEGGPKNPLSVMGMASQLGYATLPDLFFKITPKTPEDVTKEVDSLKGINERIKTILKRKLKQFMEWKDKTNKELKTRRQFMLKYLRQHFNSIKVNINWLRPYLRNIRALSQKGSLTDEDIVSAFETNKIEIELLGYKTKYTVTTTEGYDETHTFHKYLPALLIQINFVAHPEMAYQKEYQRGAIHLGRTEIRIKPHVTTYKQIEEYKKTMEKEDLELLESYMGAVMSLKEELFKYLEEAGEKIEKEIEEKPKESLLEPFVAIFKGFGDIFGGKKEVKGKPEVRLSGRQEKQEKEAAASTAGTLAWTLYDVFKKAHGMITP